MSEVLTELEKLQLKEISTRINMALSCDVNGEGIPCRTDRFAACDAMREYLEIHGYTVNQ